MNKTYKTLVHNGNFIDINLLYKGIYEANKPTLFPKEETIESIIKSFREHNKQDRKAGGKTVRFTSSVFRNIKKCELKEIKIVEQPELNNKLTPLKNILTALKEGFEMSEKQKNKKIEKCEQIIEYLTA